MKGKHPEYGTSARPGMEARRALGLLYNAITDESGEKPTLENFYPVDLNRLTQLLGWTSDRVEIAGFSEANEPLDAYVDFDNKIIRLSVASGTPKGRVNYSLAHELGHVILHGEDGIKLLRRTRAMREMRTSGLRRPHHYEVEADRFAAELLMPARAVRHRFKDQFGHSQIIAGTQSAQQLADAQGSSSTFQQRLDFRRLADILADLYSEQNERSLAASFGVSSFAMARRLIELRLVLN